MIFLTCYLCLQGIFFIRSIFSLWKGCTLWATVRLGPKIRTSRQACTIRNPCQKLQPIHDPLCFQNPRIRSIFRTNPQSVRFLRPNPSIRKPIHPPQEEFQAERSRTQLIKFARIISKTLLLRKSYWIRIHGFSITVFHMPTSMFQYQSSSYRGNIDFLPTSLRDPLEKEARFHWLRLSFSFLLDAFWACSCSLVLYSCKRSQEA